MRVIFPLLAAILVTEVTSQTYFVHKDEIRKKGNLERTARSSSRRARQTKEGNAAETNADQMVQNILQWIQEVYNTKSITRRARQQTSSRDYLPPSNNQRPRPFQPNSQLPPAFTGYPYPGSSPQPAFSEEPGYPSRPSDAGAEENGIFPETGYPPATYPPSRPQQTTRYPPAQTTRYPQTTQYPQTTRFTPGPTTEYTSRPLETTGYTYTSRPAQPEYTTPGTIYTNPPTRPTGYPTRPTDYPTRPTGYPSRPTQYPTRPTDYPTGPTDYSTRPTSYPSRPTTYPGRPSTEAPFTTRPSTTRYTTPGSQTIPTRPPYQTERPIGPGQESYPTGPDESENQGTGVGVTPDDDDLHPPHIHAIDVECAKDMMTINLEFNKVYNGIIYSKGHFNNPECRYVNENSNQIKYTFTVRLDSCGTEFINAFDTQGQSYLENVLVLQNEPGIQEAWDSIRSVRCLWEGNLKKALNIALSVGMLQQEVVTFSGDTAMAKLDIQLGRGPFAPPANGLVKIGDIMTLVISVTGDPGFDIQVRDCKARDSDGTNIYELTDQNGCVLKPKVFGAFQKTRNTQNTGASIIAYAFFSAFKFPDVMDLIMECNVELCKTDCQACPYPDQNIEPGGPSSNRRRRRDISFEYAFNNSKIQPDAEFKVGRGLKVVVPEDISDTSLLLIPEQINQVCVSMHNFVFASTTLICLLTISCIFSAHIWLKLKRTTYK